MDIAACGDVGRKMVIFLSTLRPLMIVVVLFWRNGNVKDLQQVERKDHNTIF